MKIVLLLFVVTSCYAFPNPDDWESYKVQFSKSYSDPSEDQMRKEIFLRNKNFVEEHNKKHEVGLVTYSVGLNNFSDMTEDELKQHLGYRRPTS
ncbi:digestive cysteine proteinase 1 [Halyomorpha halys]|uniref:digestive cysteine proteinase 1 n=1 Tax=Halyomorpha halys TaxID=286706 RepID=UPI0006D4CB41|nr:digestive cysteine proteinase 1 [Halyomorpha halys]